ncbi:PREDICTED: cation channel sperm-associated protein subunit gamma [Myotis brandtii]|uniref:cation channel sperm-associated protein subunit gamma n=1 Tax=Myotis brandtii TaxID=109478 RepID=UPI00070436FF|nr:PREDICTED: cation channel sperm-associated protein subunit gamma [Myotis brandtii]
MNPAGPSWPRLRVLWVLWSLMAVLLSPWRLWAVEDNQECTWQVVLNKFETIGKNHGSDRFFEQEPLDTVDNLFGLLVDAPIDPEEKYLGFPYYLKINYSCKGESSEALVRKGHLTGLKPVVLVIFQSPVNFNRWKLEQLQIQMEAAPFRSKEQCSAEEVCIMSWYTPMPVKNGSVVMRVDVSSNGLGPFIPNKRFLVNINGFLKRQQDNRLQFTVGNELFNLIPRYFVNAPSRPLWYTVDQTPVLILGGIPEEKSVLLTDTSFTDFFLVELSIDSCWVGSFYCPQGNFTATIYDAIATESTLFIRQNQLVYYFTGNYTILHESNQGSESWVRVLPNECIKKLCPVHFHGNGSEYIMALTIGKHEGYVHFGTITDGLVSFQMLPRQQSVCKRIQVAICSITWAVYTEINYNLLLLVEIEDTAARKYFQMVGYNLGNWGTMGGGLERTADNGREMLLVSLLGKGWWWRTGLLKASGDFAVFSSPAVNDYLSILYTIPEFIPDARGLEFLMILGTESYTSFPMVPKGMSYNSFNNLLFIWGNFLLQSYDTENFIYLADFPKELSIKYMVNSFHGDIAIVTETEEIWYLVEGSYHVYKLFPSKGWNVYISLQVMQQSSLYASHETMVTLFYEDSNLYQLVYLVNNQQGQLIKRLVPVEQLLMHQQLSDPYSLQQQKSHLKLSFTNFCPFTVMRLRDLPDQKIYTRQELYRAQPPHVLEPSGFHTENSLAVYQGLVYYLLWLHSKYHKPYADPVHDSTWRWWKNKKQDQDYYYYLVSNGKSAGNVHIDMANYKKIYDVKTEYQLPERIFLDKGTSYSFSIFLTSRGHSIKNELEPGNLFQLLSQVDLGVVLADPSCIEAVVRQQVLIKRNSVLFRVMLRDRSVCFDQGISGHHLMKTAMLVKVAGSAGHCVQNTIQGLRMQGNLMVPVLIGCPPGKRLAFDITYTLQYNNLQNRHYFDCVHVDPEMPCFLFRDIFHPFFLIQDLVTGESGSFEGSYVLKVVGGGPTLDTIKEYSEEEIYRFNSPLDNTYSLIWTTKNSTATKDLAFNIMSHNMGIEWLCLENSPCHDTVPHSIFAPEFFFKVLVSNRGVDKSTYCDYQLTFLLHLHGLPLNAKRALFILMVSTSVFLGLVILYIIICLLLPLMLKMCNTLRWKINNIMASDSYYSYSSSSIAFSRSSETRFSVDSKVGSKVAVNKAEPEEAAKKSLT